MEPIIESYTISCSNIPYISKELLPRKTSKKRQKKAKRLEAESRTPAAILQRMLKAFPKVNAYVYKAIEKPDVVIPEPNEMVELRLIRFDKSVTIGEVSAFVSSQRWKKATYTDLLLLLTETSAPSDHSQNIVLYRQALLESSFNFFMVAEDQGNSLTMVSASEWHTGYCFLCRVN